MVGDKSRFSCVRQSKGPRTRGVTGVGVGDDHDKCGLFKLERSIKAGMDGPGNVPT